MTQDPDTLDTWFSLCTMAILHTWLAGKTEDLDYFYPTDVLVTGYDIIFFWVIRMVFFRIRADGKRAIPYRIIPRSGT